MHIELSACCSMPLDGYPACLLRQLLKTVEHVLRHQAPLFDPAFDAIIGAHTDEAFCPLQHLHAIAAMNRADLVVHGGNAVPQAGLWRRNVHVLMLGNSSALACRRQRQERKHRESCKYAEKIGTGRMNQHHCPL